MTLNYVIVCHSGAGNHSISKEHVYKAVCERACRAANRVLKTSSVVICELVKAAVEAVKVLEDDPCTNAGVGSNLTISGKLQCDAAIMCGQSLRFGAVGCLSNIKNPIVVAEKLLQKQLENFISTDGRYPPSVLVGRDATNWATENNIEQISDDGLITVERLKKFEKFKSSIQNKKINSKQRRLSNNEEEEKEMEKEPISKKPKIDEETGSDQLDTVGVIIADSLGRVVSATSSGGIFLKQDGRLGQSCMFGSGCFSEQKPNGVSVTAVSTGLGEQLMRTMLAMRACDSVASWSASGDENEYELLHLRFKSFLENNFMNSAFICGDLYKSFGVLCLRRELIKNSNRVSIDLLFGHSTPSLCFSYLSSSGDVPQSIMSRKCDADTQFVVGSMGSIFENQ